MQILLLTNNWGGLQIAKWLRERNEQVVGLVIHPEESQQCADEIVETLGLPPEKTWKAPALREPGTVAQIRKLAPDIIVSSFFSYLIKPEIIEIPIYGCINLHQGYLPWNRGWHENVWPFLDGTPAGVTIHYIDAGVDTGDIIAQRRISLEPTDTGETLYRKITNTLIELFKDAWPLIKTGENQRIPQDLSVGVRHKRADMDRIDHIDLDKQYKARDLLNLLRARTFPPYPAAYFLEDGRRIYVRVTLLYEDSLDSQARPDWE